jgi:hypothetical protein
LYERVDIAKPFGDFTVYPLLLLRPHTRFETGAVTRLYLTLHIGKTLLWREEKCER